MSKKLIGVMAELGIRQMDLALLIGVAPQTLSKKIANDSFTQSEIKKIKEFVNSKGDEKYSVDYLFFY